MTLEGEEKANCGWTRQIQPTRKQKRYFNQCFSAARVAYNWARHESLEDYKKWGEIRNNEKELLEKIYSSDELVLRTFDNFLKNNKKIMALFNKGKKNDKYKGVSEEFTKFFEKSENKKRYGETLTDIEKKRIYIQEILMRVYSMKHKYLYVRSAQELRKTFVAMKDANPDKYGWMSQCDCGTYNSAIHLDFNNALDKFEQNYEKNRKRISNYIAQGKRTRTGELKTYQYPKDYGFPQHHDKSKGNSYHSYGIAVKNLDHELNRVFIPKAGWTKLCPGAEIPVFQYPSKNVSTPVISTDGINYYLSFSYYKPSYSLNKPQTGYIGISTGISVLATLSDGTEILNPAKNPKIKGMEKRRREMQRYMDKLKNGESSNSANVDKDKKWSVTSRKIRKLQKSIKQLIIKINDYKVHQMRFTASQIVNSNPKGIIFRDDNISEMFQDKYYAPLLQQTGMAKFKDIVNNAAERRNIEVRKTPKYMSTSVTCNCCGHVYEPIKKNKRKIFECPKCGHTMTRAHNAALNIEELWNLSEPYDKKKTA